MDKRIIFRAIQIEATIINALKQMDVCCVKLLLVFDKDDFIGILTIGDIQRAIINNVNLSSKLSSILDTNKVYASINESEKSIKAKMFSSRMECMPILDDNNKLIKIVLWNDLFTEKINSVPHQKIDIPVIIMAGGKGSRLAPITNVLPKPLVPINEKTIIEDIMDRFVNVGCNNFLISLNYKAEMIKYYFNELKNIHYHISYFQENKPLGTAGSLSLLKGKINTTFFVSNCDIIINEDYSQIYNYHKENCNEITMVAALKSLKIPYGTITTAEDGLLKEMTEKPEYIFKINAGLYILEPHLLNEIPENTFFHITELIGKLRLQKRRVGVFPISENSWLDMGSWEEYKRFIK